jgi:hypothetical protein
MLLNGLICGGVSSLHIVLSIGREYNACANFAERANLFLLSIDAGSVPGTNGRGRTAIIFLPFRCLNVISPIVPLILPRTDFFYSAMIFLNLFVFKSQFLRN